MPSDEVDKAPEDASTQNDVEMDEPEHSQQPAESEKPDESSERAPLADMEAAEEEDADADPVQERKTFASSLMSPVVTLLVGKEEPTLLTAHQEFLVGSPYFEDICNKFAEDGSVWAFFPPP